MLIVRCMVMHDDPYPPQLRFSLNFNENLGYVFFPLGNFWSTLFALGIDLG